ncbi:MAG: DUF4838 domain-containing protein [bacterium]|nr:DUF4838 domain-containing protein [bacterium]
MNTLEIITLKESEILDFASEELKKYLERMDPERDILIQKGVNYKADRENTIYLGTIDQFALEEPKVEDPRFDDGIYIDVSSGKGMISGTNERSVLLGVYRFLRELGCRWIRPGKDGEIIPKKDVSLVDVKVVEEASYRHRGICIEGAVSYENVFDIIDWSPKVGFNSYFIQFREGYTFFDRWYSHTNNPLKEKEPFSVDKAREFVRSLEKEIKRRGLLYHAVGHGWTCEPFGIPGLGWDLYEGEVPEDYIKYTAEINGKRGLWEGIPLNTNLCYSNPEVRRIITDSIVEYLEKHPYIDLLHFWLADGANNQCECEECRKTLPSDFYVMMLNELDEKLTSKGIDTKIVFLLYVDLLWPPEKEHIKNPDRFIMMFAPITRSYSDTFKPIDTPIGIPEYRRNKLAFPKNIEENIAFLKEWQKIFKGDSFDFDYHLMWAHYADPGYMDITRIIYEDIKNLKIIGLNGLISCQIQRMFFPTGLPMYVMASTLWDDGIDLEKLINEYLTDSFGSDGTLVKEYLDKLSLLFDPPVLRKERPPSPGFIENFAKIREILNGFESVIKRNLPVQSSAIYKSWLYLDYHRRMVDKLSQILESIFKNDINSAVEVWEELKLMLQREEDVLQAVFDLFEFTSVFERIIKLASGQSPA